MADLSITAANVLKGTNSQVAQGTAGATITAGQPLYADSTDSFKLKLAIATSAAASKVVGISLHAALDEQPIQYLVSGQYTVGATVVVGLIYALSATSGQICPNADLASTNFPSVLGIAISATVMDVLIHNGQVAKP